jgi:putative transcriptional regulator
MTIRHHLSDSLLMAYAAGSLPEAFALVVATHVSMCDDCRARLAAHEAVGGAMIAATDCADMADDALEVCLARLTAPPAPRPRPVARHGIIPSPLQSYLGGSLESVKWRPIGMGVRQAILKTQGGARARLLYIPAGQAVPDHGHRGTELTLVLQGAFRDETDRFGPGDVEIATQDLHHTPVAEAGADCICLAATDAPLRFGGLLPRLAQPFLRI